MDGSVSIVGCGPGAASLVTPEAREAVLGAGVVVGAPRLLALFPESTGERMAVERDLSGALDQIVARAADGVAVAVLVSGDPGLCSLARLVRRRLGRARCRVVPGISSVQVAFARLGLDWLEARVVSAHQANPQVEACQLEGVPVVAVLLGRPEALGWVAALAARLPGRRVFVLEDLTLESERVREVRVHEMAGLDVGSLAIAMLVEEELLA